MKKELANQTIKGLMWMIFGTIFLVLIKIIVLAVLARFVSPVEFGLVNAAMVVVAFTLLFTQMGVGPAVVQRENLTDKHIYTAFWISVLGGLGFSLVLFFSSEVIAILFEMPELVSIVKIISLTLILKGFIIVPLALLERNMRFNTIVNIDNFSYIFGYGIISIVFAVMGYGAWSLVYGIVSQSVMQSIGILYYSRHTKKTNIDFKCAKELLNYGGGFTIGKIGNYFALQGDNIVIAKLLGANALGIYGRAYQMMVLPANLVGTAVNKVLFPAMSSIQKDLDDLRNVYIRGNIAFALISLPIAIYFIFYANEIVLIILGNEWIDAILPLQILSVGIFFRLGYKISDSVIKATGHVYKSALRQFIYAFLIILFSAIGAINLGIVGVCIGVVFALFIHYTLMLLLSVNILEISILKIISKHKTPFALLIIDGFLLLMVSLMNFGGNSIIEMIFSFLIIASFNFLIIIFMPEKIIGKECKWVKGEMFNLLNKVNTLKKS